MKSYCEKKQNYQEALVVNLKKDLILLKLLNKNTESRFAEFDDRFSKEAIDKLRSFDKAETNDSSFISTAVRALYIHDLAALENKTFSGKSTSGQPKEQLSPQKIKCLEDLFQKRMEYIEIEDGAIKDERKKKFSKHIKNAINEMKFYLSMSTSSFSVVTMSI